MGAPGRRGCGGGPISSSMALMGPQLSWASPDSPVETEGQRDKARKLLGRAPQGVLGKRGEAGGGALAHTWGNSSRPLGCQPGVYGNRPK